MPSTRFPERFILFFYLCTCTAAAVLGPFEISPAAEVSLTWSVTSEPEPAGYKVRYGTQSRTYTNTIDVGKTMSYIVTGLQEGTAYYLAVTAYDSSGRDSDYSNEVSSGTAPSCSYSVSPSSQSFPESGGSMTVNVTALQGCLWSASSGVPWVTITSGSSGSGNGAVGLSVAPSNGVLRATEVIIAGKTFTVTQVSSCSYSISPTSGSFGAGGGSKTVSVTAPQGCAWTASSGLSWVTITSGGSGKGNGTVGLSVAANTGASRTGGITIAGKPFTVTQAASSATAYTITALAGYGGSISPSGTVSVNAGSSQAFRISSNSLYRILTVIVDGKSVGAISSYTFTNVNANHTITGTFSRR